MPTASLPNCKPIPQSRATLEERRVMKKISRPEHAYTGHIPLWSNDDPPPVKRLTPILGYQGFFRNEADRIGVTFNNALPVSFHHIENHNATSAKGSTSSPRPAGSKHVSFSPRFAAFRDCQSRPRSSPESGYGAFDGASGYGAFHARPKSKVMSTRASGYGAFENASGYGQFAQRSRVFDEDDEEVEEEREEQNNITGHGAGSGSGYGAFANASGYGNFAAAPSPTFRHAASKPGHDAGSGSGYGAFANASGYGNFAAAPSPSFRPPGSPHSTSKSPWTAQVEPQRGPTTHTQVHRVLKSSSRLHKSYERAVQAIGGPSQLSKLLPLVVDGLITRFRNRTELMQHIRQCFRSNSSGNQQPGQMTKDQLKQTLLQLYCIFSDDQATALFSLYDTNGKGHICSDQLVRDLGQLV